jgi:hypothetical protein
LCTIEAEDRKEIEKEQGLVSDEKVSKYVKYKVRKKKSRKKEKTEYSDLTGVKVLPQKAATRGRKQSEAYDDQFRLTTTGTRSGTKIRIRAQIHILTLIKEF